MKKENVITFALLSMCAIGLFIVVLVTTGKTQIEKLYQDKADKIELRLEQEMIRNEAQAKIDAINGDIQQIDSKLFDAINGTTSGTGLSQASQPQVVVK